MVDEVGREGLTHVLGQVVIDSCLAVTNGSVEPAFLCRAHQLIKPCTEREMGITLGRERWGERDGDYIRERQWAVVRGVG